VCEASSGWLWWDQLLRKKAIPKISIFSLQSVPISTFRQPPRLAVSSRATCKGTRPGADVFLCNQDHEYIGRTCNYRECHTRVACEGADCRPGSWLKTDFHLLKLEQSLCKNPPVTIWPVQEVAVPVPADVQQMLDDLRVELEEQGRVA
jgi:hypothetical protein